MLIKFVLREHEISAREICGPRTGIPNDNSATATMLEPECQIKPSQTKLGRDSDKSATTR